MPVYEGPTAVPLSAMPEEFLEFTLQRRVSNVRIF